MDSARAYPRTCGGNNVNGTLNQCGQGLSPHVRGKLTGHRTVLTLHGPIPARAGETRRRRGAAKYLKAYPRTCGGNLQSGGESTSDAGLSPHVRGKLQTATDQP